MEEKVCPWCGESVSAKITFPHSQYGEAKERKCPKCNGIMAAYLSEKRTVLERVRNFQ